MSDPLTLHVRNDMEAVVPASQEAEAWLSRQHVPPDASFLANLAIEELVSNCIKYGYDDDREHTIEIVLSVANGALTMVVVDDGKAFNPLDTAPPDLSLPINERPIGGLGLHLVRSLADDMTYERRGGMNRLTLTKRVF